MNTGYISIHPKREPVAWLTLLVIVIQIVIGLLTHNLDTSLYSTLATALGGVGIRQNVWSPQNHNEAVNHVVESMASALVKPRGITSGTMISEGDETLAVIPPSKFPDGDELESVAVGTV